MTISYQKEAVVKLHKDKEHWKFYIDCARCGNEFEVKSSSEEEQQKIL